jgi:peptidoglycan glycosyltransferase
VSCNAFFAHLALDVEARNLLLMAHRFGLKMVKGDRVAVGPDSPELAGLVKQLEPQLGQAGYGQAEVLARPVQMAAVVATIAQGGNLVVPTLLKTDEDRLRGQVAETRPSVVKTALAIKIGDAMRQVVIDPRGTGRAANVPDLPPIAAKTGTAEVEKKSSHAWFVGYAPYVAPGERLPADQRQIAFAVLGENAGYGARMIPVATGVLRAAREAGLMK